MSTAFKMSEAASIALHAMVLLARSPGKLVPARDIAEALRVSEAHLSKVLQRLARGGFVVSTRGPRGGFVLGKKPGNISLLEVYELVEGPLIRRNCLFQVPVCDGKGCILGTLTDRLNREFRNYLYRTKLSGVNTVYRREASGAKKNNKN